VLLYLLSCSVEAAEVCTSLSSIQREALPVSAFSASLGDISGIDFSPDSYSYSNEAREVYPEAVSVIHLTLTCSGKIKGRKGDVA
jgi:hypothetical protein